MNEWRIEHLEPWAAAGPGWSNRGITAHMIGPAYEEDGVIKEKRKTITLYDKDLAIDEGLALSVALCVQKTLVSAIMRMCDDE